MERIGNATLRFLLVVVVIGNVTQIGNAVNSIAIGVTQVTGFNMEQNMMQDYMTALATKFNVQTSPGNTNPWQFLFNGADAIGASMLGTIVWIGSLIACSMMFFMMTVQQILFYLEIALSPILLACLVVPALSSIAIRFGTFFTAVCIMPLGFRIVDLLVRLGLDAALNTSNNPALSAANAMGGNIIFWILTAVVAFLGYPLAGWFIAKSIVTSGHHGLGSFIPALWGMGMITSGLATRTAVTAAGAVSSMSSGPPPVAQPYRNYAVRP